MACWSPRNDSYPKTLANTSEAPKALAFGDEAFWEGKSAAKALGLRMGGFFQQHGGIVEEQIVGI
jgi:hypothetical protein